MLPRRRLLVAVGWEHALQRQRCLLQVCCREVCPSLRARQGGLVPKLADSVVAACGWPPPCRAIPEASVAGWTCFRRITPDHSLKVLEQCRISDAFPALQVIKLDIDAAEVELPFMRSIAADAELRGLIGELHFEMHYTHR